MKVTTLASLIVLAQVATACQTGPPNPSGNEIVIASDLPTTAAPDLAAPLQHAIELAVSQQGKIAGFSLKYMSLDDSLGSAPSQAKGVQNVKRMISDSRVLGMIGPVTSHTVYAEIPVANAANLVMLSPSTTQICVTLPAPFCSPQPADLRAKGPSNYFRIAPPESVQGRAMARFAAGTLKLQRVAAFNEWTNSGTLIIDSFKDELVRAGGTLVLRRDLPSGTPDFTGFLAEARANRAQAIYAVTGDPDDHVCAAAAQAKSMIPEGVYFLGTDPLADGTSCLPDAVDNANGMVATLADVDITQSSDPGAKAVVGAYQKEFPNTPIGFNTYIGAAYDCARLLIDAISRAIQANAGTFPTRAQVLDAVAHTQGFNGVTGTYSFDANGDAISPMMSIYKVENGKWVYVEKIDASANPS
jgi:ABC-type branched-subunit amino acid transport system substrate-binding protein